MKGIGMGGSIYKKDHAGLSNYKDLTAIEIFNSYLA
jgi:hypothetical protein